MTSQKTAAEETKTLPKGEFKPAILFLFGLRIIHSVGGE